MLHAGLLFSADDVFYPLGRTVSSATRQVPPMSFARVLAPEIFAPQLRLAGPWRRCRIRSWRALGRRGSPCAAGLPGRALESAKTPGAGEAAAAKSAQANGGKRGGSRRVA